MPNPLPLSWGRTVKSYEPPAARQHPAVTSAAEAAADAENIDSSNGQQASTSYQEESDLLDADFKKLKQPFQAVLVNPGWLLLHYLHACLSSCIFKHLFFQLHVEYS